MEGGKGGGEKDGRIWRGGRGEGGRSGMDQHILYDPPMMSHDITYYILWCVPPAREPRVNRESVEIWGAACKVCEGEERADEERAEEERGRRREEAHSINIVRRVTQHYWYHLLYMFLSPPPSLPSPSLPSPSSPPLGLS